MLVLSVVVAALAAYLLGNLNGAVCMSAIIAHEDVRDQGSGNAGLTNFIRNYGAGKALYVILIDGGKAAIACVNAGAQARAMERILPLLTEEEADVARRGKNAHPHHAAPKNQDVIDYHQATGLEALVGYLYLTGQEERLLTLFQASQEGSECPVQK